MLFATHAPHVLPSHPRRRDFAQKLQICVYMNNEQGDITNLQIKSIFVPDYALQGQNVPTHVTWESLSVEKVEINFPLSLQLKEVYNTDSYEVSEGGVINIHEVDSKGYLGLLFTSKILKKNKIEDKFVFSFRDSKNQTLHQREHKICLFRPELRVVDIPKRIAVNASRKFVKPRIKVKNIGSGRLILIFATDEKGDLKKETPYDYSNYIEKVKQDLQTGFEKLTESYPEYSDLIERYLNSFGIDWWDEESFRKFRKLVFQLTATIFRNDRAEQLFTETLGSAILSNVHLLTIPESFILYLASIASKKIFVLHPEEILKVSKEPKYLRLILLHTDVKLNEYPSVSLPPIQIVSDKDCEIEICRLFDWMN